MTRPQAHTLQDREPPQAVAHDEAATPSQTM